MSDDPFCICQTYLRRILGDAKHLSRLILVLDDDTELTIKAEPRHGPDFASVLWYDDAYYSFTPGQSAVVKMLWEAWENGTCDVRQAFLLTEAGLDSDKLQFVFRGHPAWNTLIKPGHVKGTFRLAEPRQHSGQSEGSD